MDTNEILLEFDSRSQNESFARLVAAAFVTPLNPTIEQLSDIKTAVSEAVTNAIIHGYNNEPIGKIKMICRLKNRRFTVIIEDRGKGIADIEKAMEPLYTTRPEWERSGMGFSFMEAFMDELSVISKVGEGTQIIMKKEIKEES